MVVKPETATRLRPLWGRLLVVESPVDEEQRRSGIILPTVREGDCFKRGLVIEVDADADSRAVATAVEAGTVVYFRHADAPKVGDLYVVDPAMLLCYEADE